MKPQNAKTDPGGKAPKETIDETLNLSNFIFSTLFFFSLLAGEGLWAANQTLSAFKPPDELCANGSEPISFLMGPVEPSVDVNAMNIYPEPSVTGSDGGTHVFQISQFKKRKSYRLRVCQSEDSYVLFDLLTPRENTLKSADVEVDNSILQKFIFGDYANAELTIRLVGKSKGHIFQGQTFNGQMYVSATSYFERTGKRYTNDVVFYGLLVNRDFVEIEDPCLFNGSRPAQINLAIGTAQLLFQGCVKQGSGNSGIYRFDSVEITDSNISIPKNWRNKITVNKKNIYHTDSHHNWCDNYAAESAETGAKYAMISWPERFVETFGENSAIDYPDKPGIWVKYPGQNWNLLSDAVGRICY